MKNKLNTFFDEAKECKENKCKIDKEDIQYNNKAIKI
jgi:hypothetical protein